MDALRSKAKNTNGAIDPAEAAASSAAAPGDEDAVEGSSETTTGQQQIPADQKDKKGGKVNPWKLVEEHKTTVAAREREIADLRKLVGDPEARKSELTRLEVAEKRAKELEEHIKFVDYSKSSEFQEKYEKPYEEKWAQTMSDLKEVTLTDSKTGEERAMRPGDMLQLVNMPLNKAMELAKELYGDSASIIMNYRSELRNMFQAKSSALEKAKTEGVEKSKQAEATMQSQQKELQTFASQSWEEANNTITTHEKTGHYFRPIDGHDELNARLEKGYKFVDETMKMNPFDPKLSAEQRAEVVAKHAAVRARAAGFGRLRAQYESLQGEYAAALKKLEQYEGSEPDTAGQSPASEGVSGQSSAKTGVFGALRKIAK